MRKHLSFESVTTGIVGNKLRLGAGVLAAIQRANCIDGTIVLSVGTFLEKRAGIGQPATGSAMNTLTLPSL